MSQWGCSRVGFRPPLGPCAPCGQCTSFHQPFGCGLRGSHCSTIVTGMNRRHHRLPEYASVCASVCPPPPPHASHHNEPNPFLARIHVVSALNPRTGMGGINSRHAREERPACRINMPCCHCCVSRCPLARSLSSVATDPPPPILALAVSHASVHPSTSPLAPASTHKHYAPHLVVYTQPD